MSPALQMLAVFGAALLVMIIATTLVLHPDYEDGLVGRIALAAIAMAACVRVLGILDWYMLSWQGAVQPLAPMQFTGLALLLWLGLALFMARHLHRFLRGKNGGGREWRPSRAGEAPGKQ